MSRSSHTTGHFPDNPAGLGPGVACRLRRALLWWSVVSILRVLFSVSARVRTRGYAPLPAGGFILASNHISHFDPPLITLPFPRRIDWIAMTDLFHGRLLTVFFRGLNVIPVDRKHADRSTMRTAMQRLAAGRVVGIFPEGGIRDGAASIVHRAGMKRGLALLAAQSGVPVVPALILGSDRLYNRRHWLPWHRAPVWVAWGAPVRVDASLAGEARREKFQSDFADAIVALRDRMVADFGLTPDDLPHSPQQRMAGQ